MVNKNRISFKRTDDQVAIVKQMGSKKRDDSIAAQEAVAAVLTEPILQVINTAPVISNLFETIVYDEGTPASIPLDVHFDVRSRNFLNVWTQSQPGGLATNFVQGLSEMFVNTYELWSAVSMNKNYLRSARLDVVAATMERIAQEILIKQELNAVNILMAALANARIDFVASNTAADNLQVVRSASANIFQLDDFNTIKTKYARVLSSWVGGTPVGTVQEITDLIGSPEFVGQIRSMAYQPVNTRTVDGTAGTPAGSSTAMPAPESLREEVYRSAGIPSIYGTNIIQSYDFGVGKAYNTIFDNYAGSTAFAGHGGVSTAAFAGASEEIVVGLNANMFNLVRLRERGANGEFTLTPDDQFVLRSDKVGYYGSMREGYVSLDSRGMFGMIW